MIDLLSNPLSTHIQTYTLAGTTAGVLEAILVNPFEVVKVSLQANKSKYID